MKRYKTTMPNTQHGFSIIELLVVMAIIGIMSGVGMPAYLDYVQRSTRSDAMASLSMIKASQVRNIAENDIYLSDSITSPKGYYSIAIVASADGSTYIATATPASGSTQVNDLDCQTFTLNQNGTKTALNSSGDDNTNYCWYNN